MRRHAPVLNFGSDTTGAVYAGISGRFGVEFLPILRALRRI